MRVLIHEIALSTLHHANLATDCPRILDVGMGEWAAQAAEEYPEGQVVGIDRIPFVSRDDWGENIKCLSPVDFRDNCWGDLEHGTFDLAHLGQLCDSVNDWEGLYRTVFR